MFEKKQTKHLANLSKISFTDSELDKIGEDMILITQLMDNIRKVKITDKKITNGFTEYSELREDIAEEKEGRSRSTAVVPRVV